MKIVDRKTFLALPSNTLYAKYKPVYFEDLCIKMETLDQDFGYQNIAYGIDCVGSEHMLDLLDDSELNGASIRMDFDCTSRDGFFDDDQLFAVFESDDVEALIERLKRCVNDNCGASGGSTH